jgi:hypothetical protein
VVLLKDLNPSQAEELLNMFAEGESLEAINSSLALHLVDLARELGRDALVGRLLKHAADVSTSDEDLGWCQFELMKYNGSTMEEMVGLAMQSSNDGLVGLAAGIYHHLALMTVGSDDAESFANRSMQLRVENDDIEGMIYGHALLAHIAKTNQKWEVSKLHLTKRLEIIPESEKFERMEALADLAHTHTTMNELEDAQKMLISSLEIAEEIQDLSGILVAKWGLADLAEISNQPDEAMVQLSDIMTAFMEAGEIAPPAVSARVEKLTSS